MIKITYYVGTCDKDTYKKELLDKDFYKVFDTLFEDYTLQKAQGVYTMQDTGTVVKEDSFIVTTFIKETLMEQKIFKIFNNVEIMKNMLNQESIFVEIAKPETMFL